MIPDDLSALGPLAAFGVASVIGMLLAPVARPFTVRFATGLLLAMAALLAARRIGLPEAPALPLLADDGLARFGALYAALAALGGLAILPARGAKEGPALVALAGLGAASLAAADHAATLVLGLETGSLALVALFALDLRERGAEAAYKYLLLGGAASAALLFGSALLYAESGSLALDGWREGGAAASLGFALLLAGLALKFALAPFHAWTPDAYDGGVPAGAAVAAVASKGAVALALLRIGREAAPPDAIWSSGLALLAATSILLGGLLALRQTGLGRMLGWSSVAHSGFLAALLAADAPLSEVGVLFYLVAYGPAALAAFAAAGALGPEAALGSLRGLARARPLAGAAFGLAMLSMAGLPIASGFVAKMLVFGALAQGADWGLLAVAVVGSGLGLFVYVRFLIAAFGGSGDNRPPPVFGLGATGLLAGSALLLGALGLYPGPMLDLSARLLN